MAANFIPQKYGEDRLREKYSLAGGGDLTKRFGLQTAKKLSRKSSPAEANCVAY